MYFPYLRGKQFELIALRELAKLPLDPAKISPIIEPLRENFNPLKTAISLIAPLGIKIHLIINPEYGELKGNPALTLKFISEMKSVGVDNIIPTYLIYSDEDLRLLRSTIVSEEFNESGYSIIHLNQITSINELVDITKSTELKYNIIQTNHIFGLRRKFSHASQVYLNDPFVKQRKNADYDNFPDENFSNDYLYFEEEGYKGFADYLTIGSDYSEGGFTPFAVAIHLTYLDEESEDIRIRRFVSDNKAGTEDIAGKFYEALTKLIDFVDEKGMDSLAIQEFREYHRKEAYPGLGVVKKLSIMHHIELIQGLL